MSMSRDRVRFKLGGRAMWMVADRGILSIDLRAAQRAFNLSPESVHNYDQITIICRPSQFARFLIYRNEMGSRNDFKDLEAILVDAPREERVIDVSKEPAL